MSECLIYFQFSMIESKENIKSYFNEQRRQFEFKKVSSVYKRKNKLTNRLDDSQELVILAQTQMSLQDLTKHLSLRIQNIPTEYKTELLAFENEIRMSPQITLPHPDLYLDSLILHCSAEVWPEYLHPISKSTLRALDMKTTMEGLEFLYQGKYFID